MNIYGTPLFRKNDTIYDPETRRYVKVLDRKEMRIHGLVRIFYKVASGDHLAPEARWREHSDIYASEPCSSDHLPTI